MRKLFDADWFKKLVKDNNIRHIIYWSDKGPHFVTCHNMYFWLIELIYHYDWVMTIAVNFFIEKHGKSYVDGHFGLLNYYYSIFIKTDDN